MIKVKLGRWSKWNLVSDQGEMWSVIKKKWGLWSKRNWVRDMDWVCLFNSVGHHLQRSVPYHFSTFTQSPISSLLKCELLCSSSTTRKSFPYPFSLIFTFLFALHFPTWSLQEFFFFWIPVWVKEGYLYRVFFFFFFCFVCSSWWMFSWISHCLGCIILCLFVYVFG